ncbi:MAG: LacI family DNA-binding transcriptional regulator [Kiritimatiellae bacterium]|nr:LacI family DNA-binding transcriptional regulator [Kiritimatiellia bacterium]
MTLFSLKDIALKIGVSTTAVSKVLNRAPIRISEEKRRLILKAARECNYRPNLIARSLKMKKAGAIGVVVPDMSTLFYPELIRLLEMALFARGYQTLICNSRDDVPCEKEHLETLRSRFIDALVIAPAGNGANAPLLRRIHESGTPVLCVDRYLPGAPFDYVMTDGCSAARRGAGWLVKSGVKHIFYLGERRRQAALDDRLAGVRDAVKLPAARVIFSAPERGEVYKKCLSVLRRMPAQSGLFFESNRFLPGFLDAARAAGKTIPNDVRVIGFDPPVMVINNAADFAAWRMLAEPLPVIRQDVNALAAKAAEYLALKLANPSVRLSPARLSAELCLQE